MYPREQLRWTFTRHIGLCGTFRIVICRSVDAHTDGIALHHSGVERPWHCRQFDKIS